MVTIFILWALVVGIGLGLFASRKWISVPLWETERKLRKELGEVRKELWKVSNTPVFSAKYLTVSPITHPEIAEPTITHRSPSDVFFFKSFEDLL